MSLRIRSEEELLVLQNRIMKMVMREANQYEIDAYEMIKDDLNMDPAQLVEDLLIWLPLSTLNGLENRLFDLKRDMKRRMEDAEAMGPLKDE